MTVPVPSGMERSPEQVAHERAMMEVSSVLTNLDHAIDRAKKARKRIEKDDAAHNQRLALDELVRGLEPLRRRYMQDAYYSGDALRLL